MVETPEDGLVQTLESGGIKQSCAKGWTWDGRAKHCVANMLSLS